MKALPALFALLLALAPVVGGAAQGAIPVDAAGSAEPSVPAATGAPADTAFDNSTGDPAATANRTVNVLDIPDGTLARSGIDRQTFDLGPALGFSTNETTLRLETEAMTERIRSTENTNRRQRLLLGELNSIEQRIITLRARQQSAIAAYGDGSIEVKQLLLRLARISAEARALEERRVRIIALAQDTENFTIDPNRRASLQSALKTFTGPVRDHAVAVMNGRVEPTRFYVAAGDGSVVLSTITNGTYVREAYRGTLRQSDGRSITPEDALNVTAEGYPVIWSMKSNNSEAVGSGNSYLVTVEHREGHLSAFVDSGSKRVFKEFQRRPLHTMENGTPVSVVRDGLRLQVNQTYPGAPLRIRLTDAQTGNPVSANITVGPEGGDSDFVGSTGFDGGLWALTPRDRFTVTAIKGNSVVFVTLEPAPIPHVNASQPGGDGGEGGNQSTLAPNGTSDSQASVGVRAPGVSGNLSPSVPRSGA